MRMPTPGPAMTTALLAITAVGGLLAMGPARAATVVPPSRDRAPRLSIASPATGNLVAGLFVNRQLRMMKSNPPFKYTLDTTMLPLLNGRGTLVLEAWAYDRAQNRGVAKPITVYVNNPINATPMQPDPKGRTGRGGEG